MSLNLATMLTETAKKDPHHKAIIFENFKMSYGELHAATNKVANALVRAGVERGQKVAILIPNIPQFLLCYFGILKAGAIVVPLNVLLRGPEVAYHLQDSDSVMLIAWEGFAADAIAGYQQAPSCQRLVIINAPGSTAIPDVESAISFDAFLADTSHKFEMVATMPDDTAVIIYTSGTTGRPKGASAGMACRPRACRLLVVRAR